MMFVRLVKPIIALKCYSQYSRCHSHTTNANSNVNFHATGVTYPMYERTPLRLTHLHPLISIVDEEQFLVNKEFLKSSIKKLVP